MLDRSNISELDLAPSGAVSDRARPDEGWMCCRACGNRVAPVAAGAELDGSHIHQRINPSGIEFEFGIFSQAPGCEVVGAAVEHDSWFPGFAWEIAICCHCAEHLGWRFSNAGNATVFALIITKLIQRGAN